jgi:rod shape-determining protein MreD
MRLVISLILVLGASLLLQTTVVSRITLLSGSADLFLVILAAWALQERVRFAWLWGVIAGFLVSGISAAPWYIYLTGYLIIIGMARLLTRRIWQAPLLAMFAVTFAGTMIMNMLTFIFRTLFENISLTYKEIFIQIFLPSVLLNLLLAITIYPLIRDIAARLYPTELDT